MLAVLPFENLSGDPGQEYFSDGITEEMLSRRANLQPERLGVITRTRLLSTDGRYPSVELLRGEDRRMGRRA